MFKPFVLATIFFSTAFSMSIGPTPCEICKLVVTGSRNFLEAEHTTAELQTFLNNTCDLCGRYSPICRGAVSSFVPKLIDILENENGSEYSAGEICSELDICLEVDYGCVYDFEYSPPPVFAPKKLFVDIDDWMEVHAE
jgi:hypothetical protein